MVKGIIFDCFGVLTADSWKEFVATLPLAQRREASDLNRAYGGAGLGKNEFLKAVYELTGKRPKDVDEMLDHETVKNTNLLQLIATLRPTYKIGLLSNVASNWIRERFLTPQEQHLFDDFTFSYEVRMTKPDPRIFALAASRLNLLPEECVLVDDIRHYCDIAEELGMRSVWYRNFRQLKADLRGLLD